VDARSSVNATGSVAVASNASAVAAALPQRDSVRPPDVPGRVARDDEDVSMKRSNRGADPGWIFRADSEQATSAHT
jgi:hypothetical protein